MFGTAEGPTCTAEDGTTKAIGERWQEGPCTDCKCVDSGYNACIASICDWPTCPEGVEPITKPGDCCASCREYTVPLYSMLLYSCMYSLLQC